MKDDLAYIEHILQSIHKILVYTKDTKRRIFNNNTLLQDAVIRNIEVIGEATKKISQDMKNRYPDQPPLCPYS